jgi:hypothetical protein
MIKIIITFCPCSQWFLLCKKISALASQAISPLDYKIYKGGALIWSIKRNNIAAVAYILKDTRIDPSKLQENYTALLFACKSGHPEIVKLLLQGTLRLYWRL